MGLEKNAYDVLLFAQKNDVLLGKNIEKLLESAEIAGIDLPPVIDATMVLGKITYVGLVDLQSRSSMLVGFDKENGQHYLIADGVGKRTIDGFESYAVLSGNEVSLKNKNGGEAIFSSKMRIPVLLKYGDEHVDYVFNGDASVDIVYKTDREASLIWPSAVAKLSGDIRKIVVKNFSVQDDNEKFSDIKIDINDLPSTIHEIYLNTTKPVNLRLVQNRQMFEFDYDAENLILIGPDRLKIKIVGGLAPKAIDALHISFEADEPLSVKSLVRALDPVHPVRKRFGQIPLEELRATYGDAVLEIEQYSNNRFFLNEDTMRLTVLDEKDQAVFGVDVRGKLEKAMYGELVGTCETSNTKFFYHFKNSIMSYARPGEPPRAWKIPRYQEDYLFPLVTKSQFDSSGEGYGGTLIMHMAGTFNHTVVRKRFVVSFDGNTLTLPDRFGQYEYGPMKRVVTDLFENVVDETAVVKEVAAELFATHQSSAGLESAAYAQLYTDVTRLAHAISALGSDTAGVDIHRAQEKLSPHLDWVAAVDAHPQNKPLRS